MAISKQELVQLAQFRASLRRFLHFSESSARSAGLTPQQHQMMLAVKGQPDREWVTVGEIAAALQVGHNAAVQLVNRAEESGLVSRSEHASDRRAVAVSLTPKGEEILYALSRDHKRELARLAPVMSAVLHLTHGEETSR